MTDLIFDHTQDNMFEALGIKKSDLKKFFVDVEEHMEGRKGRHSEALEFIWSANQSFEMKISITFALGGIVGGDIDEDKHHRAFAAMPLSMLKDLVKQMQKDGLL